MANTYLKPQSPILYKNDYIYPLTTFDQIIMPDGGRWNGFFGDSPDDVPVPSTRTINGHSLQTNVVLSAADLGDAVLKTGDTMTGNLYISVNSGYSLVGFKDSNKAVAGYVQSVNLQHNIQLVNMATDTEYKEYFNTPRPSIGLTADQTYAILTSKNVVTIEQGGTGANTAEQALVNLGAFSNKGGTITGDITATGTITATKIVGAVYA